MGKNFFSLLGAKASLLYLGAIQYLLKNSFQVQGQPRLSLKHFPPSCTR